MSFKTYANIRDFVQKKLDLQEENFITPAELLLLAEEAIKFCEAEVHKLNIEDQYFVAQRPIALVSGKADYDLPSDTYANKILRLVYSSGSEIFTISRIRQRQRFETSEIMKQYSTAARNWGYMLVNNDPRSGTKIRIFPTPAESSTVVTTTGTTVLNSAVIFAMGSTVSLTEGMFVSGTGIPSGARVQSVDSASQVTLTAGGTAAGTGTTLTFTEGKMVAWVIRGATIPVATTDYIDMPEFWPFIAQYMIVECLRKEVGNPRLPDEVAKLEALRQQMLSTLANMVPDQDDTIEKDAGSYEDMDMSEGVY